MKYDFSGVTKGNKADFMLEGVAYYDAFVALIDDATECIHLQTYIFEMDIFGSRVHQALINAAKRGVKTYVIIDSVGSKEFTSKNEADLVAAGIHFVRFNSLHIRWLYQWGRRMHHKILLADYRKAIVGGINVTTSGYGNDKVIGQQLDFAVFLEGPILFQLSRYCQSVFRKSYPKNIYFAAPPLSVVQKENLSLQISINDWVYRRWQISQRFSRITKTAEKEITIVNSYFFPRHKFMRQLIAASKRGVRVRLILPKISDWPSYILASQYLYANLLKNGIEIYQWEKSILHGKLATVDGKLSTLGSFNLNYTSYQQNLEMNIEVFSENYTTNLNSVVDEIIKVGCEKVEIKDLLVHSSLRTRILRRLFYIIVSIIANFSVILTYQEDGTHKSRNKYLSMLRVAAAMVFFLLGIFGAIMPIIPGIPFFIISLLLMYRSILFNRKLSI